ncbi:opsin, ultraviolet-sensitive-like [Macrobrachium nipponense]|uniref:opsin, ultraviolet-sensitive-like n=1 Tax=Macrobrachium nipponense TaxID=159736 RepID=UPI0030C83A2B
MPQSTGSPGVLTGMMANVSDPSALVSSTLGPSEMLTMNSRYEVKMLGWNAPPDFMDYVSPHWKTFEAPNPYLHYMLGAFYVCFLFASVCGNGVVIWIFSSARSLRTPSNMFVVNLALLDLIMMLKTPVFIASAFNDGPVFSRTGCEVYALIGSYSGIGSAMTNTAIAYDRYKTIAKPFEPKISRGKAFLVILGIWLYATPCSVLPFLRIWGRFVPEGFLTTCSFDYLTRDDNTRSFVACTFFCAYVVPGFLIMYFYSQIFSHVRAHEKAMRGQVRIILS